MYKTIILSLLIIFISCENEPLTGPDKRCNLEFTELATVWDEAIPLGNGIMGNLVWQKNGRLRFSLDRADLWDLRPMANINFDEWKFKDVYRSWKKDSYEEVQAVFDTPYKQLPAPSKIPAGALEFDIGHLGEIQSVRLELKTALCIVEWKNGARLTTFVHAEKPIGWYRFENIREPIKVSLDSPAYNHEREDVEANHSKHELLDLDYSKGKIEQGKNFCTYNQNGWGDFSYQIHTGWTEDDRSLTGSWSVSSSKTGRESMPSAKQVVSNESKKGMDNSFNEHVRWWSEFWSKSDVKIPDTLLQKQYYLEMYKFGSAARADAPPVSLQAVWTADHGMLPPWKGDYHHDLNTQMSYWPAYIGNGLDLEEGFVNWLWSCRPVFKKYTRDYFETEGMNVPGVTTLEGEPMGGWIQYAMGPTVSAWLGQHFYLHWRYSMDRKFLEEKAYPWMKDVSVFIDQLSVKRDGIRNLPLSSSPEIFGNSKQAWFTQTTNFDLALIRWTYEKAAEMAQELHLPEEVEQWEQKLTEWPQLAVDSITGLMIAPDLAYQQSHRHFSHLMGFHPLGLIDLSHSDEEKRIILNTLDNLEKQGTEEWIGFSYSWLANLYARAFQGDKAADILRVFAECFCLKNSFHVNGDQCNAGYTKKTFRPFTLEGNFAFASAIQEMVIQSHTGVIKLFPSIPSSWNDVSFSTLRTNGAFLISAELKEGVVVKVEITSEKGGEILMENPFDTNGFICKHDYRIVGGQIKMKLNKEESVILKKK